MLFTKTNTEIILIPRGAFRNGYQEALEQIHDKKIFYIDTTLSIFAPDHFGPYFFVLSKQLRKFFGENWDGKYTEQEFEEFLMHVVLAQRQGLKICEKAVKYYGGVYFDFIDQLKNQTKLVEKYGVKFN